MQVVGQDAGQAALIEGRSRPVLEQRTLAGGDQLAPVWCQVEALETSVNLNLNLI